jgi:7-cyano-7-deazaguanine reductase
MSEPSVLGKTVKGSIDYLDPIPAPRRGLIVKMTSDEVTGLCPITGAPDYYTVRISFEAGENIIESKSLKLFLQRYRERGAFCETLAVEIAQAVMHFIRPQMVEVSIVQKSRGGIEIEADYFIKGHEWAEGAPWQMS